MTKLEIIAAREDVTSKAQSVSYANTNPLLVMSGEGQVRNMRLRRFHCVVCWLGFSLQTSGVSVSVSPRPPLFCVLCSVLPEPLSFSGLLKMGVHSRHTHIHPLFER